MTVVRRSDKPEASWRPGKRGILHAAKTVGGTTTLAVNESWNEVGVGAPLHHHPDGLEEVIMVLDGRAEFWLDGETHLLEAGDLVIIPPYATHGFTNPGPDELHVLGIFSVNEAETVYASDPDTVVVIGGDAGDQLDSQRVSRTKP